MGAGRLKASVAADDDDDHVADIVAITTETWLKAFGGNVAVVALCNPARFNVYGWSSHVHGCIKMYSICMYICISACTGVYTTLMTLIMMLSWSFTHLAQVHNCVESLVALAHTGPDSSRQINRMAKPQLSHSC